MKQRIYSIARLLLLFIVLCFMGVSNAVTDTQTSSSGILWQAWSNTAFEQAKAKNVRVFLYIKADWCHWCQLMGDITLHDNHVIEVINAKYVPVKLDVDKDIDIVRQYRPTSFPTMIIMDSRKKIIKQFSGYVSPEGLVQRLAF